MILYVQQDKNLRKIKWDWGRIQNKCKTGSLGVWRVSDV